MTKEPPPTDLAVFPRSNEFIVLVHLRANVCKRINSLLRGKRKRQRSQAPKFASAKDRKIDWRARTPSASESAVIYEPFINLVYFSSLSAENTDSVPRASIIGVSLDCNHAATVGLDNYSRVTQPTAEI